MVTNLIPTFGSALSLKLILMKPDQRLNEVGRFLGLLMK
jgi:hypothetical protein